MSVVPVCFSEGFKRLLVPGGLKFSGWLSVTVSSHVLGNGCCQQLALLKSPHDDFLLLVCSDVLS